MEQSQSQSQSTNQSIVVDTEPTPIKESFVEEPKAKTDPFYEGSTAGVPGVEMDHTKIDNKSGVGVEMDQNNTQPTLCASLSSSRLYKRRMDATNNV